MSTCSIRSHSIGIAGQLAGDHRLLDRRLVEADRLLDAGDLPGARRALCGLVADLAEHFAVEEAILFPLFEQRAWRVARATLAMRREHREMRKAIDEVITAGDVARARTAVAQLRSMLAGHHIREERLVYAAIDDVLTEAERDELLRRLERPDQDRSTET